MLQQIDKTPQKFSSNEVQKSSEIQSEKLSILIDKHQNFTSLLSYPEILKTQNQIQVLNNENNKSIKKFDQIEFIELGDTKSTYEGSFNHGHIHHKTWEILNCELYKVTEYNESMECSVSDEGSGFVSKINDFSIKINNSIDKFPKFSVASLSLSDTSYQNVYDLYKKSYVEYSELLDFADVSSPERVNLDLAKDQKDNSIGVSTYAQTVGEPNTTKLVIETKSEYCSCLKCHIF
ncbi:hypothetical protein SteCoe_29958 [Stentor coeruleus]|uniref:Uncharacterized protein n=1 Tax=Stentor coeruleus TaxID=5963 RepID=A0A1R2B535_9CILI|nr:hypothetical protein SteCoe_29958 [Stentor coeruleus]